MFKSFVLLGLLVVASTTVSACSLIPETTSPQSPMPAVEAVPSSPSADVAVVTPPPESNSSVDALNNLGNTKINVPSSSPPMSIQMENGQGESAQSATVTRVRLTPPFVQTDIAPDGTSDILTIAEFATGDTASKQYVVHFKVNGGSIIQSSDLLLGEGVKVTALTIEPNAISPISPNEYAINVAYIARDPDQSIKTPTVPASKVVDVKNRTMVGGNTY